MSPILATTMSNARLTPRPNKVQGPVPSVKELEIITAVWYRRSSWKDRDNRRFVFEWAHGHNLQKTGSLDPARKTNHADHTGPTASAQQPVARRAARINFGSHHMTKEKWPMRHFLPPFTHDSYAVTDGQHFCSLRWRKKNLFLR